MCPLEVAMTFPCHLILIAKPWFHTAIATPVIFLGFSAPINKYPECWLYVVMCFSVICFHVLEWLRSPFSSQGCLLLLFCDPPMLSKYVLCSLGYSSCPVNSTDPMSELNNWLSYWLSPDKAYCLPERYKRLNGLTSFWCHFFSSYVCSWFLF